VQCHFKCVTSLQMCDVTSNVWRKFKCVTSLQICDVSSNVWRHFICVTSLHMCDVTSNVWRHFKCVTSLQMCDVTSMLCSMFPFVLHVKLLNSHFIFCLLKFLFDRTKKNSKSALPHPISACVFQHCSRFYKNLSWLINILVNQHKLQTVSGIWTDYAS